MIALKDNLPVIQLASGQVMAFEGEWLVRSLVHAAARAGYEKWWLASHVARSVEDYLHDQRDVNILPVERLTNPVQSVPQVIPACRSRSWKWRARQDQATNWRFSKCSAAASRSSAARRTPVSNSSAS